MNPMDDEIWKPVPVEDYGDYYDVSTKGRVRSHGFNRRNRLMTLETNNRGYVRVRLYGHGGYVRYYVHRLVAMAFLDNPNNCDQVNHKNLDRADNRLENLEWVSASENQSHKTRYRDEKIKMLEERIDQLKSIIKTERKEGQMNRVHAEHILDAYVGMECADYDDKARQSLREVILDAMTEYKTTTYPGITYPKITLPSDGKPGVTFTGIDPSYSTCTTGVEK